MLITEIAKKLNITPRTIRHYEEIGVIKANRLENNYRYFNTGLGLLTTDYKEYNNKKELVSYGGVSTDWETRRLFISYNINAIKSKTVDGTFMQKARAGFTPYLAGYGKLHTWLMYELHHMPEDNKTLTSNIVIRFFKSTNLLELGLDENKNTTLNFIKRF